MAWKHHHVFGVGEKKNLTLVAFYFLTWLLVTLVYLICEDSSRSLLQISALLCVAEELRSEVVADASKKFVLKKCAQCCVCVCLCVCVASYSSFWQIVGYSSKEKNLQKLEISAS